MPHLQHWTLKFSGSFKDVGFAIYNEIFPFMCSLWGSNFAAKVAPLPKEYAMFLEEQQAEQTLVSRSNSTSFAVADCG